MKTKTSKSGIELQYCPKCGACLVENWTFVKYSATNGAPLYKVRMTCPNKTSWHDGHENHVIQDAGYESDVDRLYQKAEEVEQKEKENC